MNTNNHKTAALTDVINAIQGYFSFVLGQKKLFGLLMLSTALIAMVYGFLQSPKYEATSTFVVEEKSGSGGGLAGLASQFGFDMNSLSAAGAGLFYGDNILDIVDLDDDNDGVTDCAEGTTLPFNFSAPALFTNRNVDTAGIAQFSSYQLAPFSSQLVLPTGDANGNISLALPAGVGELDKTFWDAQ